jgi:hypothetical protein
MAGEAEWDGGVTDEANFLHELLDEIRALRADVLFIREALDRAMPVIDAYLDPAASGPGAWAVRRKLAKNKEA